MDTACSAAYACGMFGRCQSLSCDSFTVTTSAYVWEQDLSGSLQGAGGVGGLLAVVKDGETYTPSFDANGNVTEYLTGGGVIVAHREYDPFGGTVVHTLQSATTNEESEISFTHWFSTKPWCPVTGLSEYEFRKYHPTMGRWLSRDPIEEWGGWNIVAAITSVRLTSSRSPDQPLSLLV